MAVSKAQQNAVNKYMAANYDRINLTVAKGQRDTIRAHAEAQGESVNAYINTAIAQRMSHDTGTPAGGPKRSAGSPQDTGVIQLPPDTIQAAQEAAEAAGEDIPQFVARAVDIQAKRDKSSLALGINPATGGKLEKEA